MNSRHLTAIGLAISMLPCLAWGVVPQHDGFEHLGVQSCAASSCHGSAGQRSTYAVLQNEYITWARHDLHSQAYKVLKNEQSQRIAANLGLEAAHTAKICLNCHTDYVPRERRGLQFDLSDGVACEACHGGAEKWLGVHISGGRDKHADSLAAGMYPTEDPVARAELCLSCHLGTADKFATHEIMGAGHPRISFDLQKFTDLQPRHYRVDADYRARKNYVEDTRVWAIGQVRAARQYLGFLQSPRLSGGGMFPELSIFDCHACHRPFKDYRWQANERSSTPPGTVLLNDSSLAMTHVIATVVQPGEASSMLGSIRELHLASQTDTAALRDVAAKLDRQLAQLGDRLADKEFDRQTNRQMIEALARAVGQGRFTDYSDAEQATMALDVYSGITGLYKNKVDALYAAVADSEVTDAKRFDPVLFAAVFNPAAAATTVIRQAHSARQPAPPTRQPDDKRPATRPIKESDAGSAEPAPLTPDVQGRVEGSVMASTMTGTAAPSNADSQEVRPTSFSPTHLVDTPALRVRFTPDTRDRIAVILYAGDEVQLLDTAGEWAQVGYESKGVVRTGWALSRLIVERSATDKNQPPNPIKNRIMNRTPPAARFAPGEDTRTTRPLITSAPLETTLRPERIVPTHVVETPALNVRFTPDTGARIAVILYAGDTVQLLETDGGWSHVAYDSNGNVRTGWALSRLLAAKSGTASNRPPDRVIQPVPVARPEPTQPRTTTPALVTDALVESASRPERLAPTHIVDASALNVRFTPDTNDRIAVILYDGDAVQLLQDAGTWSQIAYDSNGVVRTGWVVSRLIAQRSDAAIARSQGRIANQPAIRPATPAEITRPVEPPPASVTRPARPAETTMPEVASPPPVARPAPPAEEPSRASASKIEPTHIVGAYKLRLRLTPDPDAEIAIILDSGDEVQLLQSADEWTEIAYKAKGVVGTGWVASSLIVEKPPAGQSAPEPASPSGGLPQTVTAARSDTPESPSDEATEESNSRVAARPPVARSPLIAASRLVVTHVVKGEQARVRLQPNSDAGIRDTLVRGETMRVLQGDGAWSRVAYSTNDGATRTGWVPTRLLEKLPKTRR